MNMSTTTRPESVLFVSYDRPKAGRELSALDIITTLSAFLDRAQAAGTIHSVDAVSLTPVGGCVGGFILARGDEEAIEGLRLSEEFTDLMLRGWLFMDDFSVVDGVTGERQKAWLGRM